MNRNVRTSPGRAGAVSAPELRAHNLALVLEDVVQHQPTLRTSIASRTGLAKGSLTTIVPELMSAGLLRESDVRQTSIPGRPSASLEIDGRRYGVCAVQIGSSEIVVEVQDLGGRVLHLVREPHPGPGVLPETLADQIAALAASLREGDERENIEWLRCVLVAAAPIVGSPPVIWVSSDLRWDEVDLVAMIESRIQDLAGRIDLVNDANEAAVAEAAQFFSQTTTRPQTLLYIKSDTGVGGSVLIDGRVFLGAHGTGLEPAHMSTRYGTSPCDCGRNGCVIAEIGPVAVTRAAGLEKMATGSGLHVAVAELVRRAHLGDAATLSTLSTVGRALNELIFDLSLAFDPDRVIIGGYWADVFELLKLETTVELGVPYLSRPRMLQHGEHAEFVIPSSLGEHAPRLGALQRAIADILSKPHQLIRTG